MTSKFLIIFVLAVFSAQVSGSLISPQPEPKAVLELANTIIDLLQESVENNINNALTIVKNLQSLVLDTINYLVEEIIKQLRAIVENAKDAIYNIIEQAITYGLDVSKCVGETINELINLPDVILKELKECIAPLLEQVEKLITKAIDDIRGLVSLVTEVTEELTSCTGLSAGLCLQNVVQKATGYLMLVPIRTTLLLSNLIGSIVKVLNSLIECICNIITPALKKVANIVTGILKCVLSLLGL